MVMVVATMTVTVFLSVLAAPSLLKHPTFKPRGRTALCLKRRPTSQPKAYRRGQTRKCALEGCEKHIKFPFSQMIRALSRCGSSGALEARHAFLAHSKKSDRVEFRHVSRRETTIRPN